MLGLEVSALNYRKYLSQVVTAIQRDLSKHALSELLASDFKCDSKPADFS